MIIPAPSWGQIIPESLSDHVLHFQSDGFIQIGSAFSSKTQKIATIHTNAVHIPNGSSETPPDFYNKGNSSFRSNQPEFSGVAVYEFSETTNCYVMASQTTAEQFDFGRDFGASDYGYSYEDTRLNMKSSCAYHMDTPGGNIGAFGGVEWIKTASTFTQKKNIYPTSPGPWTVNDINVKDSGSAFRYALGASYYNEYFDARATLSASTDATAKVTGTYTQTTGDSNSFSGKRLLKPAEIELVIEKRIKPEWSLKGHVGMRFWSRTSKDNRGFPTGDTFLDTNSRKNQLNLGLTSINQLKPKLNVRTSLAYQQGITGGNTKGLGIAEGGTSQP